MGASLLCLSYMSSLLEAPLGSSVLLRKGVNLDHAQSVSTLGP